MVDIIIVSLHYDGGKVDKRATFQVGSKRTTDI